MQNGFTEIFTYETLSGLSIYIWFLKKHTNLELQQQYF